MPEYAERISALGRVNAVHPFRSAYEKSPDLRQCCNRASAGAFGKLPAEQMRVLMITSEWPTPFYPDRVPFVVRQVESLRRKGLTVDVVHIAGGGRPLNYFRLWRQLRAKLRTERYDLVHAQWGQAALVALPKILPLVITFRGSDLEGLVGSNGRYTLNGRVLRRLSQTMAAFADEVIVVARSLSRFLPGISCEVIPNGVDLSTFRPMNTADARRRLGWLPEKRYVLFAASPSNPIKRFALARAAVNELKKELDVELVVADGVAASLIPVYMNAADALLVTSAHEGSPNVVKEALACALPIVSVDIGDVAERIGRIDGCVLCETSSPEMLAAGLKKVLARNERIDSRRAVRELDETMIADRIVAVYERAIRRRAGA